MLSKGHAMRTRSLLAVVLFIVLSACEGDGAAVKACPDPVSTTSVEMVNFAFEPDCLSVEAGATVSLRNTSNEPHTFTVEDTDVHVNVLRGQSEQANLAGLDPGLYAVTCSFHSMMEATLKVE
jgi:plastocyanin